MRIREGIINQNFQIFFYFENFLYICVRFSNKHGTRIAEL
jgi:hypothetical protein